MNFSEIKDLIAIREYIHVYVTGTKVDTRTANYLLSCVSMIDKKIIGMLSSEDFKKVINYETNMSEQRLNLAQIR